MTTGQISHERETMRSNWFYYLLILLVMEKIVQHVFVTLAFYYNWADIRSSVAVSPASLMILGALVAILLLLSLWGMLKKQQWSINLIVFLALFDIVGEFVAQGTMGIVLNVSFIVAILLLILGLLYRRQVHHGQRRNDRTSRAT